MCRLVVLIVLVVLAHLAAPRTARADEADLVVYQGPAEPSELAAAARDRVAAAARDGGRAWLDRSPAAAPASQAAARLREGLDAYAELRWDDALVALDAAIAEIARTGGDGLGTTELSDAFLYRGLVHTQRGDTTGAWDDLVRAATVAPARTLDPLRFPTRAVEAFARARGAVREQPRAELTVDAPGCQVTIDGSEASSAEVAHGEHALWVSCPGQPAWGQLAVVAGARTVTPPVDDRARPLDDDAVAALARERGALAVLAIVVIEEGTAATVTLRIVDARGTASRRDSVTLDREAVIAGGALDVALDVVLAPPPSPVQPTRRRWWRSPWLWAAAGAAITAAVLIPFAVAGDDGGGGATLEPIGWTW